MQQHQQCIDRRRAGLMNSNNKTKYDDFYTKLERIRLSAAASSSKLHPRRTATEVLDETKVFFVKSQEVLHNRQTLSNNQRIKSTFRTAQPHRSPYHEYEQLDLSLQSSTSSTTTTATDISDCAFESVSILSLSDQTTLDSTNSPTHRKKPIVPSSITVIEQTAEITCAILVIINDQCLLLPSVKQVQVTRKHKNMAQAMFHEKVIRKRSKTLTKEYQTMATTHLSLTTANESLTKTEQGSSSFSNSFYKAINFVQQKLSAANDEQKQQFTNIREKDFLFVIINADINKVKHSSINKAIIEHESYDIITNDSLNQSWKATTKKILIRVTRLNKKSIIHNRYRRELVDTEEIWGMAKKVAIAVFVFVSLCIICCIVTTICICIKCCCGNKNNKRMRNQDFTTTSQPIVIHTGSSNYQQTPLQTWNSENHPMLTQPSAPPQPMDDFLMERPPPYEKICTSR
ncbi:unnamed protein product [Rotaria sordida]|uniref:Uncharacterized protein n=1 Tax=Rotaria sordida TaxID=392033 RepID=A0A815IQ37_9BILA|nr:unnamed protein product [Rotaria sordida]